MRDNALNQYNFQHFCESKQYELLIDLYSQMLEKINLFVKWVINTQVLFD